MPSLYKTPHRKKNKESYIEKPQIVEIWQAHIDKLNEAITNSQRDLFSPQMTLTTDPHFETKIKNLAQNSRSLKFFARSAVNQLQLLKRQSGCERKGDGTEINSIAQANAIQTALEQCYHDIESFRPHYDKLVRNNLETDQEVMIACR